MASPSTLNRSTINYSHGITNMSGEYFVSADTSQRRPGILVLPGGSGLGSHAIERAEHLASLGYATLAVDYWGERRQISGVPAALQAIADLTSDHQAWMGRIAAAREALLARAEVDAERLAAVGYCFGGATALEYARTGGELRGVVGFHATLGEVGAQWSSERTDAKLLLCTGAGDPLVPGTALETLQRNLNGSGVDWEIDIYSGTRHAFTNPLIDSAGMPDIAAYNGQSDRRSRDRLIAFLQEIFH